MSEQEINPYESVAEDAKKNLQRVKVLVSALTDKAKSGEKVDTQEVLVALLKEQLTAYSLLADVAGLAKDLDEGLTGVEEAIDEIAEAGDEEGEDEDEEEGDEEMLDDQNDETGESQLEPHHAEPIKYLIQAFTTSLQSALAQPGLDPQQKQSIEELVRLCNSQVEFIDNITLIDDEDGEEGDEDEDEEDEDEE